MRICLLGVEIVIQIMYELHRRNEYLRSTPRIEDYYLPYIILIVIGFTFSYQAFVPKNKRLPVILLFFFTICFIVIFAGLFNGKVFTGALTYIPLLLGVSAGIVMTKK